MFLQSVTCGGTSTAQLINLMRNIQKGGPGFLRCVYVDREHALCFCRG